jgi:[ribosomal protein S5]-alanine N-acetyltransferase
MTRTRASGLRLIPIGTELSEMLEGGGGEFEATHDAVPGAAHELVRGVIRHTLAMASGGTLPWGGYLAVDVKTRQVVGTCAFKAPPDPEGRAEIAYFTFPDFEGLGYATAMARELLGVAEASRAVRLLIAHTLPESNASTRVLEKIGMNRVGEVLDPEDGPVWAWQLDLTGGTT